MRSEIFAAIKILIAIFQLVVKSCVTNVTNLFRKPITYIFKIKTKIKSSKTTYKPIWHVNPEGHTQKQSHYCGSSMKSAVTDELLIKYVASEKYSTKWGSNRSVHRLLKYSKKSYDSVMSKVLYNVLISNAQERHYIK